MNKSITAVIACALPMLTLAGPALAGPDFNPPAARGQAGSTTQGWDFIFGFATEPQYADSRVVPLHNPNELYHVPFVPTPAPPCIYIVSRQVTSQPNIGDDFLTLLGTEPGLQNGALAIAIPSELNDSGSTMRIQLTYRLAAAPEIGVLHHNGVEILNDITTNLGGFTDRSDPEGSGWRQATYDFDFGRTPEWHTVILANQSPMPLDIRSIVIDTWLVPAPGSVSLLACAGLLLAHRRRRS